MPDDEQTPDRRDLQIDTRDELARGRYSNNMMVTHTREEFIMEWLLTAPSGNHLVSRVIVSPGHMKRSLSALADNLQKFERSFGEVASIEPGPQQFH